MTKITVDRETAVRAVCKLFDIPLMGTGDVYHRTNSKLDAYYIEFDFECKHPEINSDMTGIPIIYDDVKEASKNPFYKETKQGGV